MVDFHIEPSKKQVKPRIFRGRDFGKQLVIVAVLPEGELLWCPGGKHWISRGDPYEYSVGHYMFFYPQKNNIDCFEYLTEAYETVEWFEKKGLERPRLNRQWVGKVEAFMLEKGIIQSSYKLGKAFKQGITLTVHKLQQEYD